jgi:hypothetical protein
MIGECVSLGKSRQELVNTVDAMLCGQISFWIDAVLSVLQDDPVIKL